MSWICSSDNTHPGWQTETDTNTQKYNLEPLFVICLFCRWLLTPYFLLFLEGEGFRVSFLHRIFVGFLAYCV